MSLFGKIKEGMKWKNVREYTVVANTIEQIDRLSPEQRRALGIAFGTALVLILTMIFYRGYSAVGSLKSSVESGQAELNKVGSFSQEYKVFTADINRITSEIRRRPKNFSLKTFVTEQAIRSGIAKDFTTSLKEELMPPQENIQEVTVNAHFNHVTVKKLMNFLFSIERSQFVTRVKELHLKTRNDDNRYLDSNVVISTVLETAK